MKCNNCNSIIPDDSKFCKFCGAKIVIDNSTIECPSCHNQIPADSKFCPDCGSKVSVLAETKANVVVSNNNEPQEDPLNYLFPYIDKGKVGFKSLIDNNVYIPAKYEDAREFHEGFAAVKTNGKWGYMDKTGKWVLPAKEEWVEDVKDGVAITGAGNRYKAGDCLMNFWSTINWKLFETGLYTSHSDFKNGVCQVWDDGKSHHSSDNEEGDDEILLPWRKHFDGGSRRIDNKHIVVRKNNLYGIIELDYANDGSYFGCHEITPCKYPHFGFTIGTSEIIIENKDRKSGVLNIYGHEIIPMEYDGIGSIRDGLIPVAKNGRIGYLDMEGKERIPVRYEPYDSLGISLGILEHFINGVVKVRCNSKVGLLDINGNIVIPFMYDAIKEGKHSYFPNGLMSVCMNGKWGCVDSKNQTIIDFKYDRIEAFQNGKSFVQKDEKWGMIDVHGYLLIPIIFDALTDLKCSLHNAVLNGEKLVIDDYGNIVDYEEMKVSEIAPSRLWVRKGELWGLVDNTGRVIHECIFNPGFFTMLLFKNALPSAEYQGKRYLLDYFGGLKEE